MSRGENARSALCGCCLTRADGSPLFGPKRLKALDDAPKLFSKFQPSIAALGRKFAISAQERKDAEKSWASHTVAQGQLSRL